jgi:hypothetical protein
MVGKMFIADGKFRQPEKLVQRKCTQLPLTDEPITQIIEVIQEKRECTVLACTLNGWLYLVDLLQSTILKKLCLQEIGVTPHDLKFGQKKRTRTGMDNIVYSMIAYSSFNLESAPFLIVHDRLDGVYILNFA